MLRLDNEIHPLWANHNLMGRNITEHYMLMTGKCVITTDSLFMLYNVYMWYHWLIFQTKCLMHNQKIFFGGIATGNFWNISPDTFFESDGLLPTTPIHYKNQCWSLIRWIHVHLLTAILQWNPRLPFIKVDFKIVPVQLYHIPQGHRS